MTELVYKAAIPTLADFGGGGLRSDIIIDTTTGIPYVANNGQVIPIAGSTFTQAGAGAVSRTAQDKMRERVSLADFSTVAQAFAYLSDDMELRVPTGLWPITTSIVKDFAGKKNVAVICEGAFSIDNSVVTALDLMNAEGIELKLRFEGGGNAAGEALKIRGMQWGVVDIYGKGVNGNLVNVAGNRQDGTYNHFMEMRRVHAKNCGRAILHGDNIPGKYGDAFGAYQHVITNNCVNGNIFRNTNDVVLVNFDHFVDTGQVFGTDFDTCGSFHIDTFQTGGFPTSGAAKLIRIINSNRFAFDKLYILSENANVINGLYIDSSPYVDVLDLRALFFNKAVEVVNSASTSLRIGNAYCEGNTVDVQEFGVAKTLPLVSQYDSGGGTIDSAQRIAQTGYKQGWRCVSGRYGYFTQQSDNYLVLYGIKSDGSSFPVFSILMDQAAAQPFFFAQDWGVTNEAWNSGTLMRLGPYRFWVDSSGRLRIKNGVPTGDTDGTVVGTQV